jgi:hypothetical protein
MITKKGGKGDSNLWITSEVLYFSFCDVNAPRAIYCNNLNE